MNCMTAGHVNLLIKVNQEFVNSNLILSRIFDCVVPTGTTYIGCNSLNMIYVINCNRYSLQYVGETVQKFNERFNWHKTGFNYCGIPSEHLHKSACLIVVIQSNYWNNLRGMVEQPLMLRMLP